MSEDHGFLRKGCEDAAVLSFDPAKACIASGSTKVIQSELVSQEPTQESRRLFLSESHVLDRKSDHFHMERPKIFCFHVLSSRKCHPMELSMEVSPNDHHEICRFKRA